MTSSGVVVVGCGQAACQLVSSLRQMGYTGPLTVLGDESQLPYQRPPLSKGFLTDADHPQAVNIRQAAFFDRIQCAVRTGVRVLGIDRVRSRIRLSDGQYVPYEKLVLATGARPRRLPERLVADVPVHYLRTVDDAMAIRGGLEPDRRLAVLGAGYVGLEVAASAVQRGLRVDVFEAGPRVMQRSVSEHISSVMHALHTRHGVSVHLGAAVSGVARHKTNGRRIDVHTEITGGVTVDLLVAGVGAQPNIELAQEAGLECGHAIRVNASCQTSDPAIYAIGDCTEQSDSPYGKDLRLESVQNAIEQGNCAAASLAGRPPVAVGVPWFWSDQFGHRLQVAGLSQDYDSVVLRRAGSASTDDIRQSVWYLRRGVPIVVETLDAPDDFMAGKAAIHAKSRLDPVRLTDTSVRVQDARVEP